MSATNVAGCSVTLQRELAELLAKAEGMHPYAHSGIESSYLWKAGGMIEDWERTAHLNPGRTPKGEAEELCERALELTREERRARQEAAEHRQRLIEAMKPPEPE